MKVKILLTGASGTVGKKVLDQLVEKDGYDITVFSRYSVKNRKKFAAYKNKVRVVYGNLSRPEDVERLKGLYDAAIHLAAVIPPLADEKPELAQAVNTNGTALLVNLLEHHSPDTFFMYSSSIAIYGDRLGHPDIKVGDPLQPSPGDEYAVSKIRAEEIIRNSQLDWTIFRLTAIMGIKNHKMSRLMFHMPLDTRIEIATPNDAARAFVNGIEKRRQLSGKIFNLGGGRACRLSYRDLLERTFDLYGLGKFDFPPKTFAEKNFHCGNYIDGDELEKIVHFRKADLEGYFNMVEKSISPIQKITTWLFKDAIKFFLAKQSEPLKACKEQNAQLMERFF
jgi:nucleoside-diphosphate-sugar epimerase